MSTDQDYFTLFGLPVGYRIDRAKLDEAYERLTLEFHPDFFATAPAAEKQAAERASARMNEAYRVLTDDVRRTAYLIRHLAKGRELDNKALPDGFLQEMFLLQEEVEEFAGGEESPRKTELLEDVDARLEGLHETQAALAEQALEDASLEHLQAMQTQLNCERYLLRLRHALNGGDPTNEIGHG